MKNTSKAFTKSLLALSLLPLLLRAETAESYDEEFDQEIEFVAEESYDDEQDDSLAFLMQSSISDASTQQPMQIAVMPKTKPLHYLVYGDFLYWWTNVTNMQWTLVSYPEAPDVPLKDLQFHYGWDVGLRIGANFKANWKDLTLGLDWTRFHPSSTNHDSSDDTNNKQFYSLWTSSDAENLGKGSAETAHGKIHFDQLDFTMKKEFQASSSLTLAPFGGVRALWLKNKLDITDYKTILTTYGSTPPIPAGTIVTTFSHLENSINAIGLVAGLQSTLALGKGFDFFFTGDGALVYGQSKSSNHYGTTIPVTDSTEPVNRAIRKNELQVKPMLDIATGFIWDKSYKNWGILFKAAYEAHIMFDFPQFVYKTAEFTRILPNDSLLAFQGLTLGAGIRF